jgi:hypothetical protein
MFELELYLSWLGFPERNMNVSFPGKAVTFLLSPFAYISAKEIGVSVDCMPRNDSHVLLIEEILS